MATTGGARSCLLHKDISSLEVGKKADVVLVDLDTMAFSPLNDPVRQLVYSECGRSVDTVMVNGRVVMQKKILKTVDQSALQEEIRQIGYTLRPENEKAHRAADALQPYLAQMYWRCVEQDLGINRYSREAQTP